MSVNDPLQRHQPPSEDPAGLPPDPEGPEMQQGLWGRVMILSAWLLAIALLAMLFQGFLDGRDNPNRSPASYQMEDGEIEVVLQRNRSGHYVASGSINGHPVIFLLDTGATNIALPQRVASRIGISLGEQAISRTAAGDVTVHQARLDRVQLGDIVMHNLSASVLDRMEGEQVLLGMSFLRHLEWHQRGDTLTLRYAGR